MARFRENPDSPFVQKRVDALLTPRHNSIKVPQHCIRYGPPAMLHGI